MKTKTYKINEEMISSTATPANALAVIGELICLGYNVTYGKEDIEDVENVENIEYMNPPFSNEEWKEAIRRGIHGIF